MFPGRYFTCFACLTSFDNCEDLLEHKKQATHWSGFGERLSHFDFDRQLVRMARVADKYPEIGQLILEQIKLPKDQRTYKVASVHDL